MIANIIRYQKILVYPSKAYNNMSIDGNHLRKKKPSTSYLAPAIKLCASERVATSGVLIAIDVYFILVCDCRTICRLHNIYIDVAYILHEKVYTYYDDIGPVNNNIIATHANIAAVIYHRAVSAGIYV